jgi:hypothetical protein
MKINKVAINDGTVVGQSTRDPKFKGLNAVTITTRKGRNKILKNSFEKVFLTYVIGRE